MSIDIHFVFLKTSCDTLDLKLNVKWKLSNIHTAGRRLTEKMEVAMPESSSQIHSIYTKLLTQTSKASLVATNNRLTVATCRNTSLFITIFALTFLISLLLYILICIWRHVARWDKYVVKSVYYSCRIGVLMLCLFINHWQEHDLQEFWRIVGVNYWC